MTAATTEPLAIEVLRVIIRGDDSRLPGAIEAGRKLLERYDARTSLLDRPKVMGAPDRLDEIIGMTAAHYGFTLEAVKLRRRTRDLAYARFVAMWLCLRMAKATHVDIAARLAIHHSAVTYGVHRVEEMLSVEPEFRVELGKLQKRAAALLEGVRP